MTFSNYSIIMTKNSHKIRTSFYHKKVSRRIWRQFTCFGESFEKYIIIEEQVIRIDKEVKEITKSVSYRLQFIANYFQISLIILLTEFIKLNVNTKTIIKNVKLTVMNTKTHIH